MAAVAALAYASVGWRALIYQQDALQTELQGFDLEVVGTVVNETIQHTPRRRLCRRHALSCDGQAYRRTVS